MKKIKFLFIFVVAITALQSCCWSSDCNESDDMPIGEFESQYEPVFMERSVFERSIILSPPQPVLKSGKIYVIGKYLFINEKNMGFHVFNNENPSSPTPIYFIESPGATDLAIRNNVFFINQATDLIAVEVDLENGIINVTKRLINTFPEMYSPDGFYAYNLPENNVVINWIPKTSTP